MAVTRDFKELVQKRIARDPAFADALLREGIDTMLASDVDTGKAILRDHIKATIGFEKVGAGDRHSGEKRGSACSARAAIHRRVISSASSATCRSRPESSRTWRRGQVETRRVAIRQPMETNTDRSIR